MSVCTTRKATATPGSPIAPNRYRPFPTITAVVWDPTPPGWTRKRDQVLNLDTTPATLTLRKSSVPRGEGHERRYDDRVDDGDVTVSWPGMAVSRRRCDGDEPESGGTRGIEMAVKVTVDAAKVAVAADVEILSLRKGRY